MPLFKHLAKKTKQEKQNSAPLLHWRRVNLKYISWWRCSAQNAIFHCGSLSVEGE